MDLEKENRLNQELLLQKLQEIFTSNKYATYCDIKIDRVFGTAVSFKVTCNDFTIGIQGAQLLELIEEFGDRDPIIIPARISTFTIIMDVSNEKYHLNND